MSRKDRPAIGIDYGTTSALAAVASRGGSPEVVSVPQKPDGPILDRLPSYLYFPRAGRAVVGEVARKLYPFKPHKVVRSVKRDLARTWTIGKTTYGAADLVRFVLREIVAAARAHVGATVREAVLTVPSTFGQEERRIMIEAAKSAGHGLDAILLDEPLAAFLAYLEEAGKGLCPPPPARRGRVLVVDMGGGTTDISVLDVDPAGRGACAARVRGVHSDTRLGGDDFDTAIAGHLAASWVDASPPGSGPLTEDERRWAGGKLLVAAEEAKIALAGPAGAVDVAVSGLPGGIDLGITLDGRTLADIVDALVGRLREAIRHGLEISASAATDVDVVVLAGGMAFLGPVAEAVHEAVGRRPVRLASPMTAVVRGACLHHMGIVGDAPSVLVEQLRPVLTESLGLKLAGGGYLSLMEAGTELPAQRIATGCLLTPHTGCSSIRVPLYGGDGGRASGRRLLATLTLKGGAGIPGGQPVGLEVTADTNKMVHVRAFLEGRSGGGSLEVLGL